MEYDLVFKVVIIGQSGVGKSCLLLRFVDDSYEENFVTTIGVDFKIRTLDIDGKIVKLQLWDTAGQEKFQSIAIGACFRNAHGFMIVYDITDADSFDKVKEWMRIIHDTVGEDVCKVLVGNKSDLQDKRAVSYKTAKAFAEENGMPFMEASAKDAVCVDEAFVSMATEVRSRFANSPDHPVEDKIPLGHSVAKPAKSCRCG